jgi:hypothetical protein
MARRFAERAGAVDQGEGFELMRPPTTGTPGSLSPGDATGRPSRRGWPHRPSPTAIAAYRARARMVHRWRSTASFGPMTPRSPSRIDPPDPVPQGGKPS